jgi:hypothetical protein
MGQLRATERMLHEAPAAEEEILLLLIPVDLLTMQKQNQ